MARLQNFLMRRVADSVEAVAQAMFPENDFGAPDWRTAEMAPRTVNYIRMLPTRSRRLLILLYVAVELAAPLLLVWPGRFSRAPLKRRKHVLERWRRHWFPPYQLLQEALKAQQCMIFLSHPAVQAHIGVWKSCDHPFDRYQLPVREDPFDAAAPNGFKPGVQQDVVHHLLSPDRYGTDGLSEQPTPAARAATSTPGTSP